MLAEICQRTRPLRRLIHWTGSIRCTELVDRFIGLVQPHESVLDIGSGTCNIVEILRDRGFNVTPLDVKNLSFVDSITPTLYDGRTMPFRDDHFDVGLLITVLHHTPDPEAVIREAMRVCRRLIIIEDIYSGQLHKYATFAMDSLFNAEFFGHPHTNKNDAGWRSLFDALGLNILHTDYRRSFLVFSHAMYHLERRITRT